MCSELFGYSVSEATVTVAHERCPDNLEHFMEVTGERLVSAAVVHADQRGMRVEGKTAWLHSLSTCGHTLYNIDPKRGYDTSKGKESLQPYRKLCNISNG